MKESSKESTGPPGVHPTLKSERVGVQLAAGEITRRLSTLPGWRLTEDGHAIVRTFELPSIRAALAFIAYVVEVAEAVDHRPGVQLEDGTVTLTLTTSTSGGLTDADFELAARITV